jgi:hypothetical protein
MKIFKNPNAKLKVRYGQYQIAALGSIVAVSAEGMADKGAIERYSQDMMEVIANFGGESWAFLGLLHGSAILTKDAEVALQRSIEWRVQHGMELGVLVTGGTIVENLVKSQFERIYQKAGTELRIFSDEESAMAWLSERGFVANSDF